MTHTAALVTLFSVDAVALVGAVLMVAIHGTSPVPFAAFPLGWLVYRLAVRLYVSVRACMWSDTSTGAAGLTTYPHPFIADCGLLVVPIVYASGIHSPHALACAVFVRFFASYAWNEFGRMSAVARRDASWWIVATILIDAALFMWMFLDENTRVSSVFAAVTTGIMAATRLVVYRGARQAPSESKPLAVSVALYQYVLLACSFLDSHTAR